MCHLKRFIYKSSCFWKIKLFERKTWNTIVYEIRFNNKIKFEQKIKYTVGWWFAIELMCRKLILIIYCRSMSNHNSFRFRSKLNGNRCELWMWLCNRLIELHEIDIYINNNIRRRVLVTSWTHRKIIVQYIFSKSIRSWSIDDIYDQIKSHKHRD